MNRKTVREIETRDLKGLYLDLDAYLAKCREIENMNLMRCCDHYYDLGAGRN